MQREKRSCDLALPRDQARRSAIGRMWVAACDILNVDLEGRCLIGGRVTAWFNALLGANLLLRINEWLCIWFSTFKGFEGMVNVYVIRVFVQTIETCRPLEGVLKMHSAQHRRRGKGAFTIIKISPLEAINVTGCQRLRSTF